MQNCGIAITRREKIHPHHVENVILRARARVRARMKWSIHMCHGEMYLLFFSFIIRQKSVEWNAHRNEALEQKPNDNDVKPIAEADN